MTESSRHYRKREEADELTKNATIKSWEEETDAVSEPDASKGQGEKGGKGGGRHQASSSAGHSSNDAGKAKGKYGAARRAGP